MRSDENYSVVLATQVKQKMNKGSVISSRMRKRIFKTLFNIAILSVLLTPFSNTANHDVTNSEAKALFPFLMVHAYSLPKSCRCTDFSSAFYGGLPCHHSRFFFGISGKMDDSDDIQQVSAPPSTSISQGGSPKFDPLFSPHAYPKGVDAGPKSLDTVNEEGNNGDFSSSFESSDASISDASINDVEGFNCLSDGISAKSDFPNAVPTDYGVKKSVFTGSWANTLDSNSQISKEEDSLITQDRNSDKDSQVSSSPSKVESDFDPLLSPHSYPFGTSDGISPKADVIEFDPRVSPHSYPAGASKGAVVTNSNNNSNRGTKSETEKVGILLIDHGSKVESSNRRLEEIAEVYRQRYSNEIDNRYSSSFFSPQNLPVIKIAHMEIVSPSIEDAMLDLVRGSDGVDTIICHPYFLSPGRHATVDVPKLIKDTVENAFTEEERVRVNVITTSNFGSRTDAVVGVIESMVDDVLIERQRDGEVPTSKRELGGFFGEVKRRMEEQL